MQVETNADEEWSFACDFIVLRTPLLPVSTLDGLSAKNGSGAPAHHENIHHDLKALARRPIVQLALFLASRSLFSCLDSWLEESNHRRGERIARSVLKYAIRMSTRATPFGLFAACSTGTVGPRTNLTLGREGQLTSHSRIDADFLATLCRQLSRDPHVASRLHVVPNSTLYASGGRLHFIITEELPSGPAYKLAAVEPSPHLDIVLRRAAGGAVVSDLVEQLLTHYQGAGVTRTDAVEFVSDLVDSQVLVSELSVTVSGREPIYGILETLRERSVEHPAVAAVAEAHDRLRRIDGDPSLQKVDCYQEVATALAGLVPRPDDAPVFQVDVNRGSQAITLGRHVVDDLLVGIRTLHMLTPHMDDPLAEVRAAFVDRYDLQEVPLVEALNAGSGFKASKSVGWGDDEQPLLEGIDWERRQQTHPRRSVACDQELLTLYHTAIRSRQQEILLTDGRVQAMANAGRLPIHDAFSALITLAAPSSDAVDSNAYTIWLDSVGGPSGINLVARFSHHDSALRAHIDRHLRMEEAQRPDAVFAEIVHLPAGRVGNVACRPPSRAFEIVFGGRSEAPLSSQLPISDLLLSVRRGRFVLRSSRLQKEVLPRLSCAHNFWSPSNIELYRFLCCLQSEGTRGPFWSWGGLAGAPFLPRVKHRKVVLSPASWKASRELLDNFGPNDLENSRIFLAWAHSVDLPQTVALRNRDEQMFVDLRGGAGLEAAIHLLRSGRDYRLVEVPLGESDLCIRDSRGRFAGEIVIPFVRTGAPRPLSAAITEPVRPALQRAFVPGSEWFFAKIYASPAAVDTIIREVVAPLVASLGEADSARWFFVRYGDPDWHLRVRVRSEGKTHVGKLMHELHRLVEPLVDGGHVMRLQLDTYRPEVERYGGPVGLDIGERIFSADSRSVLRMLLSIDQEGPKRWHFAVAGIRALLADFGLGALIRQRLLMQWRADLAARLGVDWATMKPQLASKVRSARHHALLEPATSLAKSPGDYSSIVMRSAELVPLIQELREAEARGHLSTPMIDLVGSYVHMFTNRLLRMAALEQELVLYDLIFSLEKSERRLDT
jgi:thiopeptide-type bacteriocin biosynthesis protein